MMKPHLLPLEQEFRYKVYARGSCFEWRGAISSTGYGTLTVVGQSVLAHRMAYELAIGTSIPPGLTIDHLCRHPWCVKPSHLEVVSQGINNSRGEGWPALNARKTHCVRGHPFAGENLYRPQRGNRQCRRCSQDAMTKFRSERSAHCEAYRIAYKPRRLLLERIRRAKAKARQVNPELSEKVQAEEAVLLGEMSA